MPDLTGPCLPQQFNQPALVTFCTDTLPRRSKILSRHEEELQEQLDIITSSDERMNTYFNTAAKLPRLQANISAV